MFQTSQGSGQVFNPNINVNWNNIANSVSNSLNSIVPHGYFILYDQLGIQPFVGFILVALMITLLFYMFGSLLFIRILKEETLFETRIKRPLIIFSLAAGFFTAYTIGYLIYIFEYFLYITAGVVFLIILMFLITMTASSYRAGRAVVHAVAAREYEVARERYQIEKEMYQARGELAKVKYDVKAMENLLKRKIGIGQFKISTEEYNEYIKRLHESREAATRILEGIRQQVLRIAREAENPLINLSQLEQNIINYLGNVRNRIHNIGAIVNFLHTHLQNLPIPQNQQNNFQNNYIQHLQTSFQHLEQAINQVPHNLQALRNIQNNQNIIHQLHNGHNAIVNMITVSRHFLNDLRNIGGNNANINRYRGELGNLIGELKRLEREYNDLISYIDAYVHAPDIDIIYRRLADNLEMIVNFANNDVIPSIREIIRNVETFYSQFIHQTGGAGHLQLMQNNIYSEVVRTKNEINQLIEEINRLIVRARTEIERNGVQAVVGAIQNI